MPKVTTVKIDKRKILEDSFKRKGISELLSEVNFKINLEETKTSLIKKLISSIKRKVKPNFIGATRAEKLLYFKKNNIYDVYQVNIEEFKSDDDKFADYIKLLVKGCSTLHGTKEEIDLVTVTIHNGKNEFKGYSLLNGEVKSSYHRSSRAFKADSKYGYLLILDLPSLFAETITAQSLIKFADSNPELVKYLFVRNYLKQNGFYSSQIPKEEAFQNDYLEIANKYNLDYSKALISKELDKDSNVFYNIEDGIGSKSTIKYDKKLQNVVAEFIRQSNYIQYRAKEEYEERGEYARAFQTKKTIKLTHQKKMKNNAFLSRYGYVELDNDVDLKAFAVVERNFEDLIKHFPVSFRKDYSFRIKKLGKHRAAGAFYSFWKTTIFDLNHPNAYVHEAFHQIDYILAECTYDDCYSESLDFRTIYDLYKELLTKKVSSLPKDDSFRKDWESRTKYNKDYYLKPTEVFARSGEVYISQKGFDENSLFKTENELKESTEYIFDEIYLEKVTQFFDGLMKKLKKEHPKSFQKSIKIAAVSQPIAKFKTIELVEEPMTFEQLSLF